jgi:hypothetical protein
LNSSPDLTSSSPYQLAQYYVERREFNDALRHALLAKNQGHDKTQILQLVANIKMQMNLPADVRQNLYTFYKIIGIRVVDTGITNITKFARGLYSIGSLLSTKLSPYKSTRSVYQCFKVITRL